MSVTTGRCLSALTHEDFRETREALIRLRWRKGSLHMTWRYLRAVGLLRDAPAEFSQVLAKSRLTPSQLVDRYAVRDDGIRSLCWSGCAAPVCGRCWRNCRRTTPRSSRHSSPPNCGKPTHRRRTALPSRSAGSSPSAVNPSAPSRSAPGTRRGLDSRCSYVPARKVGAHRPIVLRAADLPVSG